jgi:hypothetical protein
MTYSLLLFSKRNPPAKSLSCLEFGDIDITRRLSLAEYYYTQPCFKTVVQVLLTGWRTTSDGITNGLL